MYILLRRTILETPAGLPGAPFTATNNYFDTTSRKPYATQEDSQVNDPFELAKDAEVFRYDYRPGKTRLVLYNGNGSVYTRNQAGAMAPTVAVKADTTRPATEAEDSADASIDLTGQYGLPPYEITLVGAIGSGSNGYRQTGVSTSELYPVRFFNLRQGEYTALVKDALQSIAIASVNVVPGTGIARGVQLRLQKTVIQSGLSQWRYNNLDAKFYTQDPGEPSVTNLPYGVLVDGFLLPGSNGKTWRQVYSDGNGFIYYVDTSTEASSDLSLHNLILFNPDTTAEQNGGVLVETQGGTPPLRFAFMGPGGPQTNTTGRLDGLAGGEHQVTVTDAVGGTITVAFKLTDRYRLWKYLDYDNLDSVPLRVELWRRDFQGEPTTICGTDQPVIIKSDGLSSSLGGQGDLPSAVGRSAELNFLAEIDLFEAVVIGDDRNCRCDFYYDGALDFRGYIKPDIYTAPLLDGLQPTSLVATDGLADLKDTDMLGHVGQRLGGHFPVLNTLLHCISRTEIALPVRIFTNRRDSAMATEDAPELTATTNRTGYYDQEKNEAADQRTVVDALAQLLGGTLVQRQGAWEIRSALEAALPAPGREYRPAGTAVGDVVAPAPSGAILPPGDTRWHWLNADQHKQVRPGWKSLKGETDAGWQKNAFWQGEVFNDISSWLNDFSQLRGVLGWHPPVGVPFPLVLQRVGEKGKDHSTLWPRSLKFSQGDDRCLISPPLPLAAGLEAVPAFISFTGKLVAQQYYLDYDGNSLPSPATALTASLPYEVVVDGHGTGIKLAEFKLVTGSSAADTTYEAKLDPLPSSSLAAVLKVYAWLAPDNNLAANSNQYFYYQNYGKGTTVFFDRGNGKGTEYFVARRDITGTNPGAPPAVLLPPEEWAVIEATNSSMGQLLVTRVGIQLRPQNATWEGEDNFRADGPGGSVRPTEALKVYHPDVPLSAGLFSGNLYAFGKGVGLADGTQTTSWSRAVDLDASPLFEATVFDQLALRANPSRLLPGTIRHRGVPPPYLLDSVDTPNDQTRGRRFLVGSATWDTKAAEVEVSPIEIGKGEDAEFAWPDGARTTHRSYEFSPGRYLPYLRAVRGGGVRVRHG